MSGVTLLLLAMALGTDAFSLSLGIGMGGVNTRQILIISLTVLLFHILMPLTGYYVGEIFGSLVGKAAGIAGALVLVFLGLKMIIEVLKDREAPEIGRARTNNIVITNTWGLILLAASVSLDALSVGFTLGTQRVSLVLAAGVIGIVAGIMTMMGLGFGRQVGYWIGEKAALIGGIILTLIGLKLFL